jgi:hypothetical protein
MLVVEEERLAATTTMVAVLRVGLVVAEQELVGMVRVAMEQQTRAAVVAPNVAMCKTVTV